LDILTLTVLESFLLDYPGCLVVVSHDRYFMDKIVDHLFVFRGEGVVEDFPGNYSDFRIYEDSIEPVKEEQPKEKVNWKENQVRNGLTFQEQKEFQKLEREIAKLEQEKTEIEKLFADGKVGDDEIEKQAKILQKVIQQLEEKEEKWFELSSKMEE
jgi:ATP-binding cassette subfamily F protein uup